MEYMLVITADDRLPQPGPGEPGFDDYMAAWGAYTRMLMERGHWISGASLQPSSTATTVRKSLDAAPAIVDGPFSESKEQVGGYYVVTATDLDEALDLAREMPLPVGSIEVRPVAVRPDADWQPGLDGPV